MKNPYFSLGTPNEQLLFQNLVDEQIKMFGIDVYYIPRKYTNIDKIFKDVNNSKFTDAYIIEAYIDTFSGFSGQGDYLSKFGIRQADELKITISRARFEELISPFLKNDKEVILSHRPSEGDLIYFPLTKNFFEVKFVEHEDPFYQVGKNYAYKLSCELYEYEDETIDTNFDEIDRDAVKETTYVIDYLVSQGTNNYKFNEIVVLSGTAIGAGSTVSPSVTQAKVASWDSKNNILRLIHITGDFPVGSTVVGVTSGTQRQIVNFDRLAHTDDSYGDNRAIENYGDDILDFNEKNPFGEYGQFEGTELF